MKIFTDNIQEPGKNTLVAEQQQSADCPALFGKTHHPSITCPWLSSARFILGSNKFQDTAICYCQGNIILPILF